MKLELVLDDPSVSWSPKEETRRRLTALLEGVGPRGVRLQVVCTDDETLREHNREYRDRDRPTDVLSFSYLDNPGPRRQALLRDDVPLAELSVDPGFETDPLGGQLLISMETLQRRGPVHAADLETEWVFMVVHGALHVLGYDHANDEEALEMEGHERELMGRYADAASGESDEPARGA